jgi:cytochrome b
MNTPRPVVVWDVPTRAVHWLLVALVSAQYASGKFGWFDMQWHIYAGYLTLVVVLFRLVWGFIGSDSARFRQFLRGPSAVFGYLRSWRNQPDAPGRTHNPLGGWSAVIMLCVLLAMALTGLATSDDIDWFGPWAATLDSATVRSATRWHHWLGDVLPWLIALHVAAIAWHELRGERLVATMLHGRRLLTGAAPRLTSAWLAVVAVVVCALVVYLLVRLAEP